MHNRRLHVVVSALLIAALLTTSFSAVAFAAAPAAPAAQVSASTVTGTLQGGIFDKAWLGFSPSTPDTDVTITITWDVDAPGSNGRHFYVLNENNLATVVAGGALQDNNIASSSPIFQGPGNQEGATFRAGTGSYTVVVANDSNSDSTFTLSTTGGTFSDDSNQVVDPDAAPGSETPAAETTEEVAAEATPEAAPEATPETTVESTADVTTTTTVTETTVTTTTEGAPAVEAVATPAETVTTSTTAVTEVRAAEMEGALPEQYDQHFLGLVPDTRDGEISLLLTFDPQDSQELARRLNFWVLDANGLQRFIEGTNASELAIAAGNRTFTGDSNERVATFTAAGTGPYTVIVYNNSQVPATYRLVATGGMLVDDSRQTTTAQNATPISATGTTTSTAVSGTTATTTTTTTESSTTAATTGSGVTGEPGGTYTVQSGDTLAIIARDVYGNYALYSQICAFNNISDCNRIEVGQVIQLPTQEQLDSGAVASVTPAAAAATPAATAAATPAATETTTSTTETATATPAATTAASALPTATAATTTGSTASSDSIIAELEANGNFTILLQALRAAGLTSQLEGAGTFTLFAPTDTAFTSLGLADVNSLIRDTALVENLLLYHMADSRVNTADVTTGEELTTLQGSLVEFTKTGQTVKVQDSNIIVPDLAASNGVIQVIDKVMLPPAQ